MTRLDQVITDDYVMAEHTITVGDEVNGDDVIAEAMAELDWLEEEQYIQQLVADICGG